MSKILSGLNFGKRIISQNKFVAVFLSIHLIFAILLGRLFAFAPDEGGYLYTFDNLYGGKDRNPQLGSGWITAPKPFLWVSYLPAKILNIFGTPDYLSIRLLSILLVTLSLILLKNLFRRSEYLKRRNERIFLFFYIPSVFLWTSVGLRESFILFEMTLVLVGLINLFEYRNKRAYVYLVAGSYGLLSTKSYLWICLVATAILVSVIILFQGMPRRRIINYLAAIVLAPSLLFAGTTSWYAFEFIVSSVFHTDISSAAARSGDSVVQVAIPKDSSGGSGSGGSGSGGSGSGGSGSGGSGSGGSVPHAKPTVLVTFHGDTTLIALHFYLINNPDALFTKVLRSLGVARKVQSIWDDKVKSGLVKKSRAAIPDSSSLSGYILKPGSVHDPLSNLRPTFLFMFGPIPLLDQGGIALNIVSLESPLWWLLYFVVGFNIIRSRRSKFFKDPAMLFAFIFTASLILFSALVEVNLGTSFRHRSIILIPLVFIFVRLKTKYDTRNV